MNNKPPFYKEPYEFTEDQKKLFKDLGFTPLEKYLDLKNPKIFDYHNLHNIDRIFHFRHHSSKDISFLFSFIDWSYMFLFGNKHLKEALDTYVYISKRSNYETQFNNLCVLYDNFIWHGTMLIDDNPIKYSYYSEKEYKRYQEKEYNHISEFTQKFFLFYNFFITHPELENNEINKERCYNKCIESLDRYKNNPHTDSFYFKSKCFDLFLHFSKNHNHTNDKLFNHLFDIIKEPEFLNKIFNSYDFFITNKFSHLQNSIITNDLPFNKTLKIILTSLTNETQESIINKHFPNIFNDSNKSAFLEKFLYVIDDEQENNLLDYLLKNNNQENVLKYISALIYFNKNNIPNISSRIKKVNIPDNFTQFFNQSFIKNLNKDELLKIHQSIKIIKEYKSLDNLLEAPKIKTKGVSKL